MGTIYQPARAINLWGRPPADFNVTPSLKRKTTQVLGVIKKFLPHLSSFSVSQSLACSEPEVSTVSIIPSSLLHSNFFIDILCSLKQKSNLWVRRELMRASRHWRRLQHGLNKYRLQSGIKEGTTAVRCIQYFFLPWGHRRARHAQWWGRWWLSQTFQLVQFDQSCKPFDIDSTALNYLN